MYSFLVDCLYSYTDLTTLGVFAGCLWYVWQTLGRPKAAPWFGLGRQLTVQRLLFGDWLSDARLTVGRWLFGAAAVVYPFEIFFVNSLYRERLLWLFDYGTMVLDHVLILCLVIKILLATRYDGRQLASVFAVLFVIRWVFVNNHDKWMMMALLFVIAAKDVPLHRALKAAFFVMSISVMTVAFSSLVGVIGTMQDLSTGRYRNSFGYGWYNYFGAGLLGIGVMYVCLRSVKKMKWFDFALLAALVVVCDLGPDSRSATMCLALLFAALLLVRFWPAVLRPLAIRLVLSAAPVLAFSTSMILTLAWSTGSPLIVKLDGLFSTRLSEGWKGLTAMPFAIAGQMPGADMLVDNAYVHYWIVAGPVASALIWLGFALLVWRLLKAGHVTEAVCCLVMLCHATMETHVMWACVNVTIWLLSGVLFWPEHQPGFAREKEKMKIHSKGVVSI